MRPRRRSRRPDRGPSEDRAIGSKARSGRRDQAGRGDPPSSLPVRAARTFAQAVQAILRALVVGGRATVERTAPVLGPLARRVAGTGDRAARRAQRAGAEAVRAPASAGRIGRYEAVRALSSLSSTLSPRRVLGAIVALSAVVLLIAQFSDYRVIIAGSAELEESRRTAGSAHLYVPLVLVALVALAAASRLGAGHPARLGRLITALGALTVAVTLAIDLPAARDLSEFETLYAYTATELLGGFYAQLFAGIALVVAGSALWLGMKPSHDRRAARSQRVRGAAA